MTLKPPFPSQAATDLATIVDPDAFRRTFGAGLDDLPALIANKTVTIPQLMALAPPGTPDPSPVLYNDCLKTFALTSTLAFACHFAALHLGPVSRPHHRTDHLPRKA